MEPNLPYGTFYSSSSDSCGSNGGNGGNGGGGNDQPNGGYCSVGPQTGLLPKAGPGPGPASYQGGQVMWAGIMPPTCAGPL